MARKAKRPMDPLSALADALRADFLPVSRLTDSEIEDGWKICGQTHCDRVPAAFVRSVPHAHRSGVTTGAVR